MSNSRLIDVAVVGAGPHGLAAAAHLGRVGVVTRVFGEPMSFWEQNMPIGMLLRSAYRASSISDPTGLYSLDRYQAAHAVTLSRPVALADYLAYGHWFQRQAVPDVVDRRKVIEVKRDPESFSLSVEDGEPFRAKRVIVATGIAPFAWRPPQFSTLPPDVVSHSVDHRDFSEYAGRRILVVGGGQSALESATLLHEAGAVVEVVARARAIRWIRSEGTKRHGPIKRLAIFLLYPPTDVGPPGWNWIVATPDLFRLAPTNVQAEVVRRAIPPRAASHLLSRLGRVPITTGRSIVAVSMVQGEVRLGLDDGTERRVDHVLLATGYRVDVSRYSFLAAQLVESLHLLDGYPPLRPGMESAVPGLHFVGAPAAWTFGPVMRFVSGTTYGSRALTRRVLGRRPLPLSFSF